LPEDFRIHNLFHTSVLKPFYIASDQTASQVYQPIEPTQHSSNFPHVSSHPLNLPQAKPQSPSLPIQQPSQQHLPSAHQQHSSVPIASQSQLQPAQPRDLDEKPDEKNEPVELDDDAEHVPPDEPVVEPDGPNDYPEVPESSIQPTVPFYNPPKPVLQQPVDIEDESEEPHVSIPSLPPVKLEDEQMDESLYPAPVNRTY